MESTCAALVRMNDLIPRHQILHSANGGFQKCPVTKQTQKMLGRFGTAERPETFAAPSRKDKGEEMIGHGCNDFAK